MIRTETVFGSYFSFGSYLSASAAQCVSIECELDFRGVGGQNQIDGCLRFKSVRAMKTAAQQ
jgi:hypothetical protein